MRTDVNSLPLVVLDDGSTAAQHWLDQAVQAAVAGSPGEWPHAHSQVPSTNVSLSTLVHAIENSFWVGNQPWSVVTMGFPPPPGAVIGPTQLAGDPPPDDDMSRGSMYHNMLHSLLGNFH
jgi:hypothetical protein